MCGIVGYIGQRPCIDILFNGLSRLEYRGYDSAGMAVLSGIELGYIKTEGKLAGLRPLLDKLPVNANRGIGHTRWATHGGPTTVNAHPHVFGNVALVHNGIIENHEEIKHELRKQGVTFESETDTEVVLHLFLKELSAAETPLDALYATVGQLQGAFSLGLMVADDPECLYLVKQGSPLVIGLGKGENFFASDAMALLSHTNRAVFLNDGELARITEDKVELMTFNGEAIKMLVTELDLTNMSSEKQGYRHYMLKEIHEQPQVMAKTIRRLVDLDQGAFAHDELGLAHLDIGKIENVVMVACGTAYYSALLGKYFLEPVAGLPVNVELASEFRYRKPWLNDKTLIVAVSQSGETADTLACVKHARKHGCQVMSVCNVEMSSIPRESDATLYMKAGPEIGVASTKAFTSMLLCHYLFGLALGHRRGIVKQEDLKPVFAALRSLPSLMAQAVDTAEVIENVATTYYGALNFIFIGRGPSYGISLEGALKLKEISYIHAEGYAGGELKHGPIALIDRHMPVVALAPRDQYYEKMLSNIEEVKAREGLVIGVGSDDDSRLKRLCNDFIPCPQLPDEALQAILSVVPLQLLAYYMAVKLGTDVDQPRNLAKSVTVE